MIEYVHNPVFARFCSDMKSKYHCSEKIEFSSCSWQFGWNIKFKKSGKTLCTIYPKENYFTVLVVVGMKQKESVEAILEELTPELRVFINRQKRETDKSG